MEVQKAIEVRKSVRAYSAKPVPDEVVARILEAGRTSPSATNYQPWHFVVVTGADKRKVLAEGVYAGFIVESPLVIVGLADRQKSPKWHLVDTTIALQTMVLAATAEGLGTCWVGSFNEERVRKLLNVPDNFVIVAMISVGYPRGTAEVGARPTRPRNRKSMDEIVSFEEFGVRRS